MSESSPRILYFDIETFPLLADVWSRFVDGPVIAIERDWNMACIAWQWEGEKTIHVESLRGKDPHDDLPLVVTMWRLFDQADFVIGHNGDKFDIKKVQARMLLLGMDPPSPFQSVDTLRIARRHFALTSNKLDDLCQALGMGQKAATGGWALWAGCLAGDDASWAKMEKYNRQDIVLLKKLYETLRPWMSNHPIMHPGGCHVCGSDHLQKRGTRRTSMLTYQLYQCLDCGAWPKSPISTGATKPEMRGDVRK
jgi:uncharacterized protein YprB with RNaseH-like and TPR domain